MNESVAIYQKWANRLSIIMIMLAIIITSVGLFYKTGGEPVEATNIYGETLLLYGDGVYANDTVFQAGLNKGTDIVMLFLSVPLLIFALAMQKKKYASFIQFGIATVLLYYSASLGFGIAYNFLFLLYLILFSVSLFAVVLLFLKVKEQFSTSNVAENSQVKGMGIFIIIAGISTFVWLVDIIANLVQGDFRILNTVSTTKPTGLLDIGIIAPLAFLCGVLLIKKKALGYAIAPALLVLNAMIGITVISQSLTQYSMGTRLTIGEIILYVVPFLSLSFIAFFFFVLLCKRFSKASR